MMIATKDRIPELEVKASSRYYSKEYWGCSDIHEPMGTAVGPDRLEKSRESRASTLATPSLLTSQAQLRALLPSTDEAGAHTRQEATGTDCCGTTAYGQNLVILIGSTGYPGSKCRFGSLDCPDARFRVN